ncbi:MAG: dihydrofolate reductase [Bdellovibrionales bacterium]|nr:dihydrofolate reductase [Bdellovibrionales bacterium]
MKVIAIAAVARNGTIGNDLDLPWEIPEDMRFFRQSTKGQVVIMGRKTFDSLKKALPNRENIVITRDQNWKADDVRVFNDLGAAIEAVKKEAKTPGVNCFVIGGAQIYGESFKYLDEVWLTEIDKDYPGDIKFPDYMDGTFLRPEFDKFESTPQKEATPFDDRYFFCKYRRK